MIKGISLTASMRSNLMSLSNISTQMDKTQNILSTGKKVNSAIDNASSYYQARSLSNRAADLTSLLDSMGQGIQTIQAASEGLESATSYLEQMKSVAEQALALPDNSNTTNAPTPPQTQQRGPQFKDNSAELIAQGYKALDASMSEEEIITLLGGLQDGDKVVLTSNFAIDSTIDLSHLTNVTINGGGHTISCGGLELGDGATIENAKLISNTTNGLVINGNGTVKNVSLETTEAGFGIAIGFEDGIGTVENVDIKATAIMVGIYSANTLNVSNTNITCNQCAPILGGIVLAPTVNVDGLYIDCPDKNAGAIGGDVINGVPMGEREYPDEYYSGKENSQLITTACSEYYVGDKNGKFGQGEWYRASIGELKDLYGDGSNMAVVNNTLSALVNDNIAEGMSGIYWLSNDVNDFFGETAYCFNINNGTIGTEMKSNYNKDRAMWSQENYFDPSSANKPKAGDIMYLDGSWGTLADYDSSKASQVAGVICNTDENGTVKVIGLKDLTFASESPYDFDPENPYGNDRRYVMWGSGDSGVEIKLSSILPDDTNSRTVEEVNNAYNQKYGTAAATTFATPRSTTETQSATSNAEPQPLTSQVNLEDNSAELAAQGYKVVDTSMDLSELSALIGGLQDGDKVVFTSDFYYPDYLDLSHLKNLTINGGGHTISCGGLELGDGSVLENANLIATVGDDYSYYGLFVNGSGKVKNVNIEYTYTGSSNSLYIAPLSFDENGVIENVNIVAKTPVTSGVLLWQNLDAKNVTLDLQAGCMAGLAGMGTISVDGMSMNEDAVGLMGFGPYAIASGFNIPGFEDKSYVEPFDIMGTSLYVVDIADVNEAFARAEDSINGKESSADMYADYIKQYNQLINEFNNLLADASYQGVNLLTGGKLNVTFNESRTHNMTVNGKDMRTDNIGLNMKNWSSKTDIETAIKQIVNAMNEVRSFSADLGNKYTIIQTRQNFTEALTDVLETGADDLVLADMNEASAEYLMLQTRQQLAINSLSLASQSAKSILSLF